MFHLLRISTCGIPDIQSYIDIGVMMWLVDSGMTILWRERKKETDATENDNELKNERW